MIRLCIWGLLRFTLATLLFCVAFSVVLPTVASAVTNAKGDTAVTLSPSKNLETISLALGRPINAQVFMVDGPPTRLFGANSRRPIQDHLQLATSPERVAIESRTFCGGIHARIPDRSNRSIHSAKQSESAFGSSRSIHTGPRRARRRRNPIGCNRNALGYRSGDNDHQCGPIRDSG